MSYIGDGLPLLFPASDHRGTLAKAIQDVGLSTQAYDLFLFAPGILTASQKIAVLKMTRAITLPVNFGGSQVSVGTNPTNPATISVKKNGVEFGTIAIATNGVVTLTATATSFAVGDVISIVAPVGADATLSDLAITLVAALAS